ncbi:MAG: FecR domain-containing protein [Polyangiaceae bacterium]
MTRLEELGRVVTREQDAQWARARRDTRGLERFLRSVSRPTAGLAPRSRGWVAAAALVAVAAAVAIGVVGFKHGAALFAGETAPPVGRSVVAHAGQTVPLSFPDGSQVVLESGCEAVVHELNETGAKLELSRGEAAIAVRHRPNTNWQIAAGPYAVRVTGTRFSLMWSPERARFELRLAQGSVVVTSKQGRHAAVTMMAPETLVIDASGWKLGTAPPTPSEAPVPEPAQPAPASAAQPEPASVDSSATATPTGASPARSASQPSWEGLLRSGNYSAAYSEASRHGISQLADGGSASSLLSLAEVCRFSGHNGEATLVLQRLRSRFPATENAATAAFQLGRMAGDAAAVSWFRTYLQERPNGAFAREASGRLLEALSRSGDRASAKQAAESYLARYPNGTHAAFARQLLGR